MCLPLRDFFLDYKQLAWEPGERVTRFLVPSAGGDTRVHFEKVSKRKHLDIATVNSAIRLRMDGQTVVEGGLALGGVAPVPLYCREASARLRHFEVSTSAVAALLDVVQDEVRPISDVRGSAAYKQALARRLVAAHFVELFPDRIKAEAFL